MLFFFGAVLDVLLRVTCIVKRAEIHYRALTTHCQKIMRIHRFLAGVAVVTLSLWAQAQGRLPVISPDAYQHRS